MHGRGCQSSLGALALAFALHGTIACAPRPAAPAPPIPCELAARGVAEAEYAAR